MQHPLKILVVDDDRDNADSLAELFEVEGHTADVAYSGEDAIAMFAANGYDLAFMDVMMPGRNGVESFIEIRRTNPKARVYMMTGFTVEQLLQQALDNGALGVLTKPVDPAQVMASLESSKPNSVILIADDDPKVGQHLRDLICGAGRTCELVRDAEAEAGRLAAGAFDCMILDLRLPLINGLEVYTRLRKQIPAVPTIMITGGREPVQDALDILDDVEITGVLTKPFDPAILLAKLDRLVA